MRGDVRTKETVLQVGTGLFGFGILGSSVSWSCAPCLLDHVLNTQDAKVISLSGPSLQPGLVQVSFIGPFSQGWDCIAGVSTPRSEEASESMDCIEGGQSLHTCAQVSTPLPWAHYDVGDSWGP